jgi:hypothetical protein
MIAFSVPGGNATWVEVKRGARSPNRDLNERGVFGKFDLRWRQVEFDLGWEQILV